MELDEIKSKLAYLEEKYQKYSMLITLNEFQITKFIETLDQYKTMNSFDTEIITPKKNGALESVIKEHHLNYTEISSIQTINYIESIINNKLTEITEIENNLNSIINQKYIFNYEIVKIKILKAHIIKKEEDLNTITTKNNIEKIKEIVDYKNKINIINKHTIEKHIIKEQKNIIQNIDNEINSLCYTLNIECQNKTYKEKYFEILDKIKGITMKYKEALKELNSIKDNVEYVEKKLTEGMKKIGAEINLPYEHIKELSTLDISELINDLKIYETSKERFTKDSKKMF